MHETAASRLIAARLASPLAHLLGDIAAVPWQGHNIALSATQSTFGAPGQPLIGDSVRARVIKKQLRQFAGNQGSLAGVRLLDLGCLEGGLSFELAREDAQVLGVDGRESNIHKCKLIERYFALPNLRFALSDVKQLSPVVHGVFDAVLCLGLLYHLDQPAAFLELLGRSMTTAPAVMFMDTHVAPADEAALDACDNKAALSTLQSQGRGSRCYEGRWYHEYAAQDVTSAEEWTAVSNHRSFWLTETSLIKAMYAAGFTAIYAVYGSFDIDEEFALRRKHSRVWYVAVKESPIRG